MPVAGKPEQSRIHGRETITLQQYNRLSDAYEQTGSIGKAASIAGVGASTAARYVNRGSDTYEAIRPKVARERRTAAERSDRERIAYHDTGKGIYAALLKQLRPALLDTVLAPTGKINADGKTVVNEHTFARLSSTAQSIHEFGGKVLREAGDLPEESGASINTTVNVGVGVRTSNHTSHVKMAATEFIQSHKEFLSGGNGEPKLVAALLAAKSVQERMLEQSDS